MLTIIIIALLVVIGLIAYVARHKTAVTADLAKLKADVAALDAKVVSAVLRAEAAVKKKF